MTETRFPTSGLSAEYGDIILSNVNEYVVVDLYILGQKILTEKYIADVDSKIYIKNIGDLAMAYFADNEFSASNGIDGSSVMVNVLITEKGATDPVVKDVTIYPSNVDFSGSLSVDMLLDIPLSRHTNKTTSIGRKEWVSFYVPAAIKIYAVYKGTSQDESKTIDFASLSGTSGTFHHLDVSPSVVAAAVGCEESNLVYYNVYKSADSIIRFSMGDRVFPNEKTFVFRNCFGAMESFACTGGEKSGRKWTRSFGTMGNSFVLTSRDLENKFTVNTGFLSSEDIEVVEDLLNSEHLCLLDESGFQEVVVLEENFDSTDSMDELNYVEFTYKYSSGDKFRTAYKPFKKPRVFSVQFDEKTFS